MAARLAAIPKTLVFTLVMPGSVGGWIPWLVWRNSEGAASGAQKWLAFTVIGIGVAIYLYTAFWSFAVMGGGTPAPIDPPKILVVKGLHRYVRNPMYIGVLLAVAGQTWLFHSSNLLTYLVCLAIGFHLFVLLYEEPTLHSMFGAEYDRYRAAVPRWIPSPRR